MFRHIISLVLLQSAVSFPAVADKYNFEASVESSDEDDDMLFSKSLVFSLDHVDQSLFNELLASYHFFATQSINDPVEKVNNQKRLYVLVPCANNADVEDVDNILRKHNILRIYIYDHTNPNNLPLDSLWSLFINNDHHVDMSSIVRITF